MPRSRARNLCRMLDGRPTLPDKSSIHSRPPPEHQAPAVLDNLGQPGGEHRVGAPSMALSTVRGVPRSTDRRSRPPEHHPGRHPGRSRGRRPDEPRVHRAQAAARNRWQLSAADAADTVCSEGGARRSRRRRSMTDRSRWSIKISRTRQTISGCRPECASSDSQI